MIMLLLLPIFFTTIPATNPLLPNSTLLHGHRSQTLGDIDKKNISLRENQTMILYTLQP